MTDWHDLMSTLASQACDLELLQLRTALDHLMLQPNRIMAVRRYLHIGQEVGYFDVRDSKIHRGRVIEFKPDQLLVQSLRDLKYRWMAYAAVQIDTGNTPAQQPPPPKVQVARREDFVVGDSVSFEGRDLIRKFGTIERINQKTASVLCEDGVQWRVSFALLQRVVNV